MSTKKTKPAKKPTAKKVDTASTPASEKQPHAPKDQRNGVTRPKPGTICAGIWDVCDSMKAVGQDTTFEEIKKVLPKVNDATIRTQRQRWKTYNG